MDEETKERFKAMEGLADAFSKIPGLDEQSIAAFKKVSAMIGITAAIAENPEAFVPPIIEGETQEQYEERAKEWLRRAFEEAARRAHPLPDSFKPGGIVSKNTGEEFVIQRRVL